MSRTGKRVKKALVANDGYVRLQVNNWKSADDFPDEYPANAGQSEADDGAKQEGSGSGTEKKK